MGLESQSHQNSILDRNVRFVTGNMRCATGYFYLPDGPGLGVAPTDAVFEFVM
jgi:L-alanine-DL-glutamate epimerase-like enolase superfamily enzyme